MRRGFTLVELLVVIVIIAALAALSAPQVMKQVRKADQTEATSNAKQIGLALFEFDTAYSSLPSTKTATDVTANLGGSTNGFSFTGGAANDFFRQMIAAETVQSESIFFAKTAFSKKPDNVFSPGTKALEAGEVGFGYIMNGQEAITTAGNPSRPIAVAALAYNGAFDSGKFDPDIYNGQAVVLRLDQSASSVQVLRSTGLAQLGGGKTLLQTGPDSVWGTGVTPTIVNPLPR